MNAVTLILVKEEEVPQSIGLSGGVIPNNDRPCFIEQAGFCQRSFECSDLAIKLGHFAIHVEVLGIRMASQAVRHIRCESVVGGIATHVAGNAGVRDR